MQSSHINEECIRYQICAKLKWDIAHGKLNLIIYYINRHRGGHGKGDHGHGTNGRGQGGDTVIVAGTGDNGELEALRKELAKTKKELEDERRRMRSMYYCLLPTSTADQLLSGKNPQPSKLEKY